MISFKTFLESAQDDRHFRQLALKLFTRVKMAFLKGNKSQYNHAPDDFDEFKLFVVSQLLPNWEGEEMTVTLLKKGAPDHIKNSWYNRTATYKGKPLTMVYIKDGYDDEGNFTASKATFVHEFMHAIDLQGTDPEMTGKYYSKLSDQGLEYENSRKFRKRYVNSGWEYNAKYQEAIVEFESTVYKKGPKFINIIRNFNRFLNMIIKKHMYWNINLNSENKKRLIKRLYSYHQDFFQRHDEQF